MPAWVVPAAIAAGTALVNMVGNWRARKINENYVREQNEYNSPRSQMQRFQAAGLNPRLIYGQGTPGLQSESLRAPEGMSRLGSDTADAYNKSAVTQSQVSATDAKIEQTRALTEVNKLQAQLLSKNPLLDSEGFRAIIDGLKETAELKGIEIKQRGLEFEMSTAMRQHQLNRVVAEVKNLEKQFDLLSLDEQIKGQVLQSKQFENAILEVQKRFMADKEIGPQQVFEFIKILLMRLTTK